MKAESRGCLCVVIILALLFAGYLGLIISSFAAGARFYRPFVVIVTGVLAAFTALWGGITNKGRILLICLMCFVGLCILVVTGYEINRHYIDNLAVVSDRDVDLRQYRPFDGQSKVARLDEESPLTLVDALTQIGWSYRSLSALFRFCTSNIS